MIYIGLTHKFSVPPAPPTPNNTMKYLFNTFELCGTKNQVLIFFLFQCSCLIAPFFFLFSCVPIWLQLERCALESTSSQWRHNTLKSCQCPQVPLLGFEMRKNGVGGSRTAAAQGCQYNAHHRRRCCSACGIFHFNIASGGPVENKMEKNEIWASKSMKRKTERGKKKNEAHDYNRFLKHKFLFAHIYTAGQHSPCFSLSLYQGLGLTVNSDLIMHNGMYCALWTVCCVCTRVQLGMLSRRRTLFISL